MAGVRDQCRDAATAAKGETTHMTTSIPEEQTNHRAGNGDKEGTCGATTRPRGAAQGQAGP